MRSLCLSFGIFILIFGWIGVSHAQEIVYRPINPSFGGHPLNSSHLLGLAERQNPYQEDRRSPFGSGSTDQFQRQIQTIRHTRRPFVASAGAAGAP